MQQKITLTNALITSAKVSKYNVNYFLELVVKSNDESSNEFVVLLNEVQDQMSLQEAREKSFKNLNIFVHHAIRVENCDSLVNSLFSCENCVLKDSNVYFRVKNAKIEVPKEVPKKKSTSKKKSNAKK